MCMALVVVADVDTYTGNFIETSKFRISSTSISEIRPQSSRISQNCEMTPLFDIGFLIDFVKTIFKWRDMIVVFVLSEN